MPTPKPDTFIFNGYSLNSRSRVICFYYNLASGHHITHSFTETFAYPSALNIESVPGDLLRNILDFGSLMVGAGYWKTFAPKQLLAADTRLHQSQLSFWRTFYSHGLGQFFYENKLQPKGAITFVANSSLKPTARRLSTAKRAIVPIGGGKDSAVTGQLLKEARMPFSACTMGKQPHVSQTQTIKHLRVAHTAWVRTLDPQLFTLNKKPGVLNGHVPITGIYSFVALLTAAATKSRFVVMSEEKSANYGNVRYHGMEINHQWSKTEKAEGLIRDYIHQYICKDITYFSLLRPWHEIYIAKLFAGYKDFHKITTSCNLNFTQNADPKKLIWSSDAKSAFVFALYAAFMPKAYVVDIFGMNLFGKKAMWPLYQELLGVAKHKPFECVGTPEEVRLAMVMARERDDFADDIVIKHFTTRVFPKLRAAQLKKKLMKTGRLQNIPKPFQKIITSHADVS